MFRFFFRKRTLLFAAVVAASGLGFYYCTPPNERPTSVRGFFASILPDSFGNLRGANRESQAASSASPIVPVNADVLRTVPGTVAAMPVRTAAEPVKTALVLPKYAAQKPDTAKREEAKVAPVAVPEKAPVTVPDKAPVAAPEKAPVTVPKKAPVTVPEKAPVAPKSAAPRPALAKPAAVAPVAPAAQPAVRKERLFTRIVDAYIYAYPLVLMNEIEKEMTDSDFFAPINKMAYVPTLPGPRFRMTECPNVDALTAFVWFDLAAQPQVLVFPNDASSSYIVELIDAWTNVIHSFGAEKVAGFPVRLVDGQEARCAILCGPDCKMSFPKEMTVIKAPTNKVLMIDRVLLGPPRNDGEPNIAQAARTLYQFNVLPWSAFEKVVGNDSRSEAQTRLLHYLNARGLARYASNPIHMPLAINSDFNLFDDTLLDDGAPKAAAPKPREPKDEQDKTKGKEDTAPTATPPVPAPVLPIVPIDPAAGEVERDVTRQVDEALSPETTDETESEIESEQEVELSQPVPCVIYQTYRTRRGYVRYAQTVMAPPAAAPAPARHSVVGELEKDIARDAARADHAVKSATKSVGKDVTAATRETEKLSDELLSYMRKSWTGVRDFTRDGIDYGKEAVAYFDRKAKRDYRRVEQLWSEFERGNKWSDRPEERIERMTPEEFFTEFVALLGKNPPNPNDVKTLALLKELGIVSDKPGEKAFDGATLEPKVRNAMRYAVPFARTKLRQSAVYALYSQPTENNWFVFHDLGQYGTDYLRRAIVASEFIGANIEKEVVYPFTFSDADGVTLDGAKRRYVVHFPAGATPPTETMWSITLYDAKYGLTTNRWNRYAVRSNMPLVPNPDGSLDILIQHETPDMLTSNWLPAPNGPFMLMMRIYRPDDSVLSGKWRVPPVTVRKD